MSSNAGYQRVKEHVDNHVGCESVVSPLSNSTSRHHRDMDTSGVHAVWMLDVEC